MIVGEELMVTGVVEKGHDYWALLMIVIWEKDGNMRFVSKSWTYGESVCTYVSY